LRLNELDPVRRVRRVKPDNPVWEGRKRRVEARALVIFQAVFDLLFDEEEGPLRSGMAPVVGSKTNVFNQLLQSKSCAGKGGRYISCLSMKKGGGVLTWGLKQSPPTLGSSRIPITLGR
jgi:hypothetical protein